METMSSRDPAQDDERALALAREMIDRVADKWSLLVISALGKNQKLRFTQLRNGIDGVSQKMLTQTLRQLERDGFVARRVYAVVPPKVDYHLTELGSSLLASINSICVWVHQHLSEIEGARNTFDGRSEDSND